jgi:hypothetical protein
MLDLDGNEATVTLNVTGAAETFMDGPFPHAQHIHIGAQGVCPTPDADQNGDGAVNVEEGHPFYGMIATSLTTDGDTSPDSGLAVDRFPGGSSYTYSATAPPSSWCTEWTRPTSPRRPRAPRASSTRRSRWRRPSRRPAVL